MVFRSLAPADSRAVRGEGPGLDPTRAPVIGQSFDRTLTVTGEPVPEPASAALPAIGLVVLAGGIRRGRRRTPGSPSRTA